MRVSHTVLMVRYKARCYEHNLRLFNEYEQKEAFLASEGWTWKPGVGRDDWREIYGQWMAPEGVTELPDWFIL